MDSNKSVLVAVGVLALAVLFATAAAKAAAAAATAATAGAAGAAAAFAVGATAPIMVATGGVAAAAAVVVPHLPKKSSQQPQGFTARVAALALKGAAIGVGSALLCVGVQRRSRSIGRRAVDAVTGR